MPRFAPITVEAGRAYVKAYVNYIHFVEKAYALAEPDSGHEGRECNTRGTPTTCESSAN